MDVKATKKEEWGNAECVALLELWLAKAKEGGITHLALAACEAPNIIYADVCGSIIMQSAIHSAIDGLKKRIDDEITSRLPPFDPNIPANQVCYNVSSGILGYDFLPWLINAEMRRVRMAIEEPLKIAFFRHANATTLPAYHYEMLQNVARPMVSMVGAEANKVFGGEYTFSVFYKDVVDAVLRGEKIPKFTPMLAATLAIEDDLRGLKQPVTITLREATHSPWRNSDLTTWMAFAKYLEDRGEEVIFIRDTRFANDEFDDFSTHPAAAVDLHVRTALYQQAKCNLFVSNGPMTINYHLDTPFMAFIEVDEGHHQRYRPGWPEFWPECMGIEVGQQFPWFNEAQRIVWKKDSLENLIEAWEQRCL